MEDVQFYLLGMGSGLLVATFSYWLALRFPPKARLHQCYGELLPVLEEIALLQKSMENLRSIDLTSGRDFWPKYIALTEYLITVRDADTIREVAALLPEDASILEDEKAASELLVLTRLIVQRSVNIEIAGLAREVFRLSIALKLLKTSQDMQKQLEDVKKVFTTQLFQVSARSIDDLKGVIDTDEIRTHLEAQAATFEMMFGSDVNAMLELLATTMKKDLKKKL